MQDAALELLAVHEQWTDSLDRSARDRRAEDRAVRTALVSALPKLAEPLFGAAFLGTKKKDPFEQARNPDGSYDIDKVDDTQVEWSTPGSEEEEEELNRWLKEREGLVPVTEDLPGGGDWM